MNSIEFNPTLRANTTVEQNSFLFSKVREMFLGGFLVREGKIKEGHKVRATFIGTKGSTCMYKIVTYM